MTPVSCRPITGLTPLNLPSNQPPHRPIRTLRVNIVNNRTKWPPWSAADHKKTMIWVILVCFSLIAAEVSCLCRVREACACIVLSVRRWRTRSEQRWLRRRWNRVFRDFIKKSFIYELQIRQKNKRPETLPPFWKVYQSRFELLMWLFVPNVVHSSIAVCHVFTFV